MIRYTGYKEIDNVLKHLPDAVQDSVVGSANMRAAKVSVEKEKLLAPEGPTGNLVDSIGAVRRGKKGNVIGEVWVGPRRKGRYKGFAGHLVEFGTRKRRTKKGANRGVMPMKKYAKPAWEATKGSMEGIIKTELSKSVVRTMKKYLK